MSAGARFFDYEDETSRGRAHTATFLDRASVTDWSMLMDYGSRRLVEPGEMVIVGGNVARSLLIVLSGTLIASKPSRWRSRRGDIRIEAGSVVGEFAFFDGQARSRDVVAAEHSEVFVLTWESFERLASVRPGLALLLLEDLGRIVTHRFRALAAGSDG